MRLLKEVRNLIGNYHVKSGVYHYYRNEYTQAVDFLTKALRDTASLDEADRRKACRYLTLSWMDSAARQEERGETALAIEELRRAAEVSPEFPDIRYRLGRLLERAADLDGAIAAYRSAIACNPSYLEAQVALGFCLLDANRAAEAAETFSQALAIKQRKLEQPFAEGLARLERGATEEAREFLRQVFLGAPRLSEEFARKALERLRAEDHEAALEQLDRALELNPGYPDLHNYRGVVLCELGRLPEAIEAFGLSAKLSPGYLVPRLNLAFAHLRAGDERQAEQELETIVELDPSEPAAVAALAELRAQRSPDRRRPVSRGGVR